MTQRVENVPVFANKPIFDFCGVKIIDEKTGTIEVPSGWKVIMAMNPTRQPMQFINDKLDVVMRIEYGVASVRINGRDSFWIPTEGNEKLLEAMGATIVVGNMVVFPVGWTVRRFKELPDVDEIYTNHGEYKYRVFRDSGNMYPAEQTKMLQISDILHIVTVPTKGNELVFDENKIKIIEKNRVQLPAGWSVKRSQGSNLGAYEIWNKENKLVTTLKDTIDEDILTHGGGVHQRIEDQKRERDLRMIRQFQTQAQTQEATPKEGLTFEYRLTLGGEKNSGILLQSNVENVRKIVEVLEREGLKGHVVFTFQ